MDATTIESPYVLDDVTFSLKGNFQCVLRILEADADSFTAYLTLRREGVTHYECEEVFTPRMTIYHGSKVVNEHGFFNPREFWSKKYAKRVIYHIFRKLHVTESVREGVRIFALAWDERVDGFHGRRSERAA